MRRRKLKGFVLPTLYLLITITIFTGVILLGSDYEFATKDYNFTTEILDKKVVPVMMEDNNNLILSPVEDDKASITVHYYNIKANEEEQRNSLIYYENTYMPNTGVLYTSDEKFNIINVFDGKVIEIKDDEFFTKCIVIEHDNNLKTYYYGVDDIKVKVGDVIDTSTILGVSSINDVLNSKESFLFEVYHNNKLINPEEVFNTSINDYE